MFFREIARKYRITMNYAMTVKGFHANNDTVHEVQEQAFLEIQRFLTAEELTLLKTNYSVSQLAQNIKKVRLH